MYGLLGCLFGKSKDFGTLGIAKVVLVLWKKYFWNDLLYQQVMSWLLLRGNEQEDWFPRETHHTSNQRTVEDQLLSLCITDQNRICEIRELIKCYFFSVSGAGEL